MAQAPQSSGEQFIADPSLADPSLAARAVAGMTPRSVERPLTGEAVATALHHAGRAGLAVVPWGAGTKQGIGNPLRAYDVALDLSALDAVLAYEPADLVVTVQAGIPLARLGERLTASGQFLALDPPHVEQATLGGTLSTNMSGPSRLLYGTARDLVLGMRVATAGGELIKTGGQVVKNVAGYDLNKMYVGALGTLGVIIEVTLKVHPVPKAEATVVATFPELDEAHTVAGKLFRSVLYPRAVELVRAPLEEAPDSAPAGTWRVLVWAAGSPTTVARQTRDALAWCQEAGATDTSQLQGNEHAAIWQSVREFGRNLAAGAALVKLTCLPSQLAQLATSIDLALNERQAGSAAILMHAGSGVMYAILPAASAEQLQAVLQLPRALGGSAVMEQAPLELKRGLDVWGPKRDDFHLMQALKAQFDPHSTLNPGRFVGGI